MISQFKNLKYLLSFTSLDSSIEANRSKERYRRSFLTSVSVIFSKFISSLVMFISIPLTISYLGNERFGLWMTISSVLLVLNTFSDLGLGTSYMNKVSEFVGKQNTTFIRKYTSNTFLVLCSTAFIIFISFLSINPLINWEELLKIQTPLAQKEVGTALTVLVTIFALSLPFILVEKFQEGNQEGYKSNIWQSSGNLLSLGGIFIVVYFKLGVPALIIATSGTIMLTRIINFLYQFYYKQTIPGPNIKDFDPNIIKNLFRIGIVFFAINVFQVIGYNSDHFIISNILGVSAVSLYSVVQKLSLVALIFWSFTNSLWPAYTEALARKDYQWIQKTIRRTLLINVILGIFIGIFLTLFGSPIISLWTEGKLVPPIHLLLGFSFYILVNGLVGTFAIIYNSSFILKWQLPLIIVSSISSIFFKIIFCKYYGVAGVVWATVISYSLFYILPSIIIINKFFIKKLKYLGQSY